MPQLMQSLPHWLQLTLLIVPGVSAILAATGLFLNFYQSRRTNAQARAALVAGCLKGFIDDDAIQRAFYLIEYSKFDYDSGFHDSETERDVDKLLRHFANLALSWQSGLLSLKDIRPMQYYLLRVMTNPGIQKYMRFMETWTERLGVAGHPYAVLEQLCQALLNGGGACPHGKLP
jgi:hypothetical protein